MSELLFSEATGVCYSVVLLMQLELTVIRSAQFLLAVNNMALFKVIYVFDGWCAGYWRKKYYYVFKCHQLELTEQPTWNWWIFKVTL